MTRRIRKEINCSIDLNELCDTYYHIQIHFKRPIDRARGSIEFDLTKSDIQLIIDKICKCCNRIEVEDRAFHPATISRISICITNCESKDLLPDKSLALRSQKYDYLYENAQSTIKFHYPKCKDPAEWFRIYRLILLIPLGTGIGAWAITGVLFSLPIDKVVTAIITVGPRR